MFKAMYRGFVGLTRVSGGLVSSKSTKNCQT